MAVTKLRFRSCILKTVIMSFPNVLRVLMQVITDMRLDVFYILLLITDYFPAGGL